MITLPRPPKFALTEGADDRARGEIPALHRQAAATVGPPRGAPTAIRREAHRGLSRPLCRRPEHSMSRCSHGSGHESSARAGAGSGPTGRRGLFFRVLLEHALSAPSRIVILREARHIQGVWVLETGRLEAL